MKLSRLEILEYAKEGVQTRIGVHPAPNEYPEDIEELEAVLAEIERRIARAKAREQAR
jgi:hypothetical protein